MLKQLLSSVSAENIYVERARNEKSKKDRISLYYVSNKGYKSGWNVYCSFKNFKKIFKEVYGFDFKIRWDKLFYFGGKNFKGELN